MENWKYDVTVVLATYGRPESCRIAVQSCAEALRLAGIKNEIIVGINGTDSATLKVVHETSKSLKNSNVRILTFADRETPSGFRNKLVGLVNSEWIYFIDDDAFVDSDFFLKFDRLRKSNPSIAVFGGPNLTPPKSNIFQRATGITLASRFATYFSFARYSTAAPSHFCGEEALILCNLFIRSDALWEKPFLAELICCEESWLLQELETKGFQFLYDSSLFVWHERRSHIFSLSRQVFKYGFGRGQILKKEPSRLRPAHLLPTICLFYTILFIFLLLVATKLPRYSSLPFVIYPLLCVAAALSSAKRAGFNPPGVTAVISALLFPVIHICYGCGLFWGLVRG